MKCEACGQIIKEVPGDYARQSMAGKASAAKLTPEQRSNRAFKAATVRWARAKLLHEKKNT